MAKRSKGVEKGWLARVWFVAKEEEMGTGARGAPVPEVGLYVKIKRAQFRNPGSRPNEGRVNSP